MPVLSIRSQSSLLIACAMSVGPIFIGCGNSPAMSAPMSANAAGAAGGLTRPTGGAGMTSAVIAGSSSGAAGRGVTAGTPAAASGAAGKAGATATAGTSATAGTGSAGMSASAGMSGTAATSGTGGSGSAGTSATSGTGGAGSSGTSGAAGSGSAGTAGSSVDAGMDDPFADPGTTSGDATGPCKDLGLFCFDIFDMFIINPECFTCNNGDGCMDCVGLQAI